METINLLRKNTKSSIHILYPVEHSDCLSVIEEKFKKYEQNKFFIHLSLKHSINSKNHLLSEFILNHREFILIDPFIFLLMIEENALHYIECLIDKNKIEVNVNNDYRMLILTLFYLMAIDEQKLIQKLLYSLSTIEYTSFIIREATTVFVLSGAPINKSFNFIFEQAKGDGHSILQMLSSQYNYRNKNINNFILNLNFQNIDIGYFFNDTIVNYDYNFPAIKHEINRFYFLFTLYKNQEINDFVSKYYNHFHDIINKKEKEFRLIILKENIINF